jgi:hypothetical protein
MARGDTELRVREHTMSPSRTVIEVWWRGKFLMVVTPADGPGVRITTKYPVEIVSPVSMMTEVLATAIDRIDAACAANTN